MTNEKQYKSRMILCDKLCKPTHDYHRCNNQSYEGYVGCDVWNITYEIEDDCNSNELFPCEECDKVFEEYENVRQHFLNEHERYEMVGCIENCNFTVKSVDMLIKHIGVEHYNIVKQRL